MCNRGYYINLGASNHSRHAREENDYYATDPVAGELLLEAEPELDNIWECACGEGHLARVFETANKLYKASDIENRGYGSQEDFLGCSEAYNNGDIVTNPPYCKAQEFVEKALELVDDGRKVCMFLKVLFLESSRRKKLFQKYPPKAIYVSSSRINCAKNGDFETYNSGAVAYAWYVWEKGYTGDTVVRWIN